MIRTATRNDLPALLTLARSASDAPYDLGAVLDEKCFGGGFSGDPRTRVFESDGAIRGLAVQCGKYLRLLAVDRAFRRRGIGTALLRDAAPRVIGAEPGNYFTPGVAESDDETVSFFEERGYRKTAETWNLHTSVPSPRAGRRWPEAPGEGPRTVSPLEHGEETDRLLAFVRREFGPIWAFETARALRAVWIENIGFAVVEANNRGLGTFGPTGVAPHARGKGHGRALLLAALQELASLGFERAVIPWTDALEFYRRACGATPAHRFAVLRMA